VLAAPDVSFELGDTLLDTTANAIANVGDLDGDGYPELATLNYDYVNQVAYVHLRYGGPRPEGSVAAFGFGESRAFLVLDGTKLFAGSLKGAGDVDGDGHADLLVATGVCDTTQPEEGVYLVYGAKERLEGTHRLGEVSSFFTPPQRQRLRADGGLGCSGGQGEISAPGDIDGDGFADLFLSEQYIPYNDQPTPPDAAKDGQFLFYGRAQRFPSRTLWASADAHLHSAMGALAVPVRDANGDGLADLIIGAPQVGNEPVSSFWLPGRTERLSGDVELGAVATPLAGVSPYTAAGGANPFGDLDGDGIADVLLTDQGSQAYLFYGAAGLFDDGVDLGNAAARFPVDPTVGLQLIPAGDRDGDGDAELIDQFWDDTASDNQSDIALLSGQRQRLGGDVSFPIAEVRSQPGHPRFDPGEQRAMTDVIPAGDLDGDGADDLLTVSETFIPDPVSGGLSVSNPQLHIHYGTPVPRGPIVR
jgi:hypothetical protein